MKILICGDVVGRAGRRVVCDALPTLRRELDLDFIVVNGENAAGGFGITPKICDQFFDVRRRRHYHRKSRLGSKRHHPAFRPGETPATAAQLSRGYARHRRPRFSPTIRAARCWCCIFMGLLFMPSLDDPFAGVEMALLNRHLGSDIAAIILDFHGEATSEKLAIAHMLDGRISAAVGTHTHVPTADAQVLPGGTGYISDIGMCGDYDSVIGMKKEGSIERFRRKLPGPRLEAGGGRGDLVCGVYRNRR